MKHAYRKPYRVKRRKSIFKSRFFWLGLLVFIFIAALFYTLFFFEAFQVKQITIAGTGRVSAEELRDAVENKLENEILFLKTKSIFLISSQKIKEDILSKFPQIAKVEIKRTSPDALSVWVAERAELVSWWQKDTCFLLDGEGIIFEKCPSETSLTKLLDQKNTTPLNLGEKVIEKEYLDKILETHRRLTNELKIEVEEMAVFSNEFDAKTPEGWKIYLSPEEDLDWQLTKLSQVIEKEIPPERRKDLDYIELRFGNFAPYKYKEAESIID